MQSLEINTELKNLIPPLTEDEYQRLEKSILTEGCRDAIIVWNKIIIDGHNRYEICKKHGINFALSEKEMPDIDAVKEWIILNQFGRRNLSAYDRSLLALKLEGLFREKAKENLSLSGGDRKSDNAKTGSQISAKAIDTRQELAKIAGVSHDTIAKVKVIDNKATPEQKGKLKTGEISINQAYVEIKKAEKVQQRAERDNGLREVEKFPDGLYTVIYADPPWRYDFSETNSREIENQYPTMDIEEIKAMQIPTATNAVLFLWATAPKLREALGVMEAWGFEYKTHAIWDKGKIGMGYWFRGQHELLLVGTKGNYPPPAPSDRISSVISIIRTKHSAKPDLYGLIEKMCPGGKYLELFARGEVGGKWAIWGNQAK